MGIRQIVGFIIIAVGFAWLLGNLIRSQRKHTNPNSNGSSLAERVARLEGRMDFLIPLQIMLIGAIVANP